MLLCPCTRWCSVCERRTQPDIITKLLQLPGASVGIETLKWVNWRRLASVFVPALLITAVSTYVLTYRMPVPSDPKVLPGRALAAYDELYPIRADKGGSLYLDRDRFIKAIDYFSENASPRAIADLIYLGSSNNVTLLLDPNSRAKYLRLAEGPEYRALAEIDRDKDRILHIYRDIVNGVGMTFAGTPIETVLHDTRNPLRSVVAVQNPISGRRIGDANTNFGLQLIKNYSEGKGEGHGAPFVSYPLTLKDGRQIKSTTIPIFHEVYGLVAFICINVDISRLDSRHAEDLRRFMDNFKATVANDAINEIIENSRHHG